MPASRSGSDPFEGMSDDEIRAALRANPYMPKGPPTPEQAERALKRAERAGAYDPKTRKFVWDD